MEIGIEQARKTLGDIANRVHLTQETMYLTRNGRRVAAITPLGHIEETSVSATTTSYGSWVNLGGGFLSVEDSVHEALGEYAGSFDVDGLVAASRAALVGGLPRAASVREALGESAGSSAADGLADAYQAAIDAALPEQISIHGSEFVGPHPAPADATDAIRSAVAAVGFWMLADRFDTT